MSETSSDAESSCGWTIISNEGSDIETLGLENAPEDGLVSQEVTPVVLPDLQDLQAPLSGVITAVYEGSSDVLEDTLKEDNIQHRLSEEDGVDVLGTEPVTVCSSSDHSDIMTLGDHKEDEHAATVEEVAIPTEFYLGTSSSSHYTFTAAETVFPVLQPQVANCSSSEDEALESPTNIVRRRRLRKNTTSISEAPDEEIADWARSEDDAAGQDVHLQEQANARLIASPPLQGPLGSTLNKCVLLALVIAISMGLGHFCGTIQTRERQKVTVNELGDARDLLKQHFSINQEVAESLREDLHESDIVEFLTGRIESFSKDNQELRSKQAQLQVQLERVVMQLKQTAEERNTMESLQYKLTTENQLLKSSLEREENSLFALQEQLRNLHSKIGDLEDRGADSLRSENERLNDQLEEERQQMRSFLTKREALQAEAQTLRKELDEEQKMTDQLRKELDELSIGGMEEEAGAEKEKLQSRLVELEKKLSFEQQRSDLWERLYVETKEERTKGDTQPKVKKHGMIRKVKNTFEAVKNSTKEFVHHHKEQIKKVKEAVKENLRKFSDSVKSTLRHFKDSASYFMKDRGPRSQRFDETEAKESWQHSAYKSNNENSFNTRKYGGKVQEPEDSHEHKATPNGCFNVFDCAYQESMSLFNIAMEPIRADEFHQLLHSYLQQEVNHFQHWKEVEKFINNFFHNGVFIHDQMLFTDFVSVVEDYLVDMHQYQGLDDDVFEDLDEYVYRHFFGETYAKHDSPTRPYESPNTNTKEGQQFKQEQRKQQKARAQPERKGKWSRSGRNSDRHMADVKIELGPMPFDPKY